jgi:hypothetical protein
MGRDGKIETDEKLNLKYKT